MAYNYIVTAQKTTAVFNCCSGNFTSPTDLNLILDKLCRIEIHVVTPGGLRSLKEVSIYGQINVFKSFRMRDENKDLLFILTTKNNAMILEMNRDAEHGDFEVITRAHGMVTERIGRPSENGPICDINPKAHIIALRIYDGILNILKLDFKNKDIKSYNIRLEEHVIMDFVFLSGYDKPIFAFIYQEDKTRHLKTYEITEERELRRGPWIQENIESDSSILIPVKEPFCGVLVIGQESITHIVEQNSFITIAPPEIRSSAICCYCEIDHSRFLLGDMSGRLFMVILKSKSVPSSSSSEVLYPQQTEIILILIGEISIPSCLTYLDNYHIYVGSRFGNSQLIKLVRPNLDEENSSKISQRNIEVVDTYISLAPIVDMLVVDLDKQGQDQLITCSGFSKEGSIRIVRNGIGITELATIDLTGVKGVWQLKIDSDYDSVVAVAFVGQTKLLKLDIEEAEETFIPGFDHEQQTLFCGNLNNGEDNLILQATARSIRLISLYRKKLLNEWISPNNISLISVNDCQLICSSRSKLFYLEIVADEIKLIQEVDTEFEASCLDISPLGQQRSELCVVGFWNDISVKVFSVPDFRVLHTEKLSGEIIPRSSLMANLGRTNYLFIAIGDGSLLYYVLDENTGIVSEKKKVILGTQPTFLKLFKTNSSVNIFACSDRPTVIYSHNNKLIFSNVNLKEVYHMCPFNSIGYPDSLIVTDNSQLLIGQIDQIQKLHIRTIMLNETPRRIAYQESTQTFGVISMRYDVQCEDGRMVPCRESASTLAQNITHSNSSPVIIKPSSLSMSTYPNDIEVYHLLIIDQTTFEVLHAHQFMTNEHCCSLISAKLGDDPNYYYIVGTVYVTPEEMEPKDGRIIMFQLKDGKLQQVAEKECKGIPFSMVEFHGKLLVTVSSSMRLFEWTPSHELNMEVSIFTTILSILLKTRGDFVLVGDMVRSLSLYVYSQVGGTFTPLAHDLETSWLSTMEMIDDDIFIGADNSYNLFLAQKEEMPTDHPEKSKYMSHCGFYHLGDMINVMIHGNLVMNNPCDIYNVCIDKPIIYGTYSGSIGLIAQIPVDYYDFLMKLKNNLAKKIKSVGKINYDDWRTFVNAKRKERAKNFIDGDLIESFLDMNSKEMAECVEDLWLVVNRANRPATVDDVIKIVEELSRIH